MSCPLGCWCTLIILRPVVPCCTWRLPRPQSRPAALVVDGRRPHFQRPCQRTSASLSTAPLNVLTNSPHAPACSPTPKSRFWRRNHDQRNRHHRPSPPPPLISLPDHPFQDHPREHEHQESAHQNEVPVYGEDVADAVTGELGLLCCGGVEFGGVMRHFDWDFEV